MKHQLIDYLNIGSLTPDASMMGELSNTDWWTAAAEQIDNLIWLLYPNRTVFFNDRFPFNPEKPNDTANINATMNNIKRSFAIYLKSNDYTYSRLYNTIIADYNPLYNVDAFEYEKRKLDKTGTDTSKKTGTDTTTKSGDESVTYDGTETNVKSGDESVKYDGTESNIRSGNETDAKQGQETNVKSGNETDGHSGSDTTTTAKTTFDSALFNNTDQVTSSPATTDTHTYNNVTDTTSFNNRSDTHTYNNVTDTKSFDKREDTHEYNDVTDTKSFQNRVDTHEYNDVTDEIEYNSTMENTKDLHDNEETERRRYGNIGVTKSTDLIDSERKTVLFNFYKRVVHDLVNLVTYAVE